MPLKVKEPAACLTSELNSRDPCNGLKELTPFVGHTDVHLHICMHTHTINKNVIANVFKKPIKLWIDAMP